MDTKFHKDLMTLAGHTYNNGNFRLPNNWQELTSFSANNGFQATVYKNGNNNEYIKNRRNSQRTRRAKCKNTI